MRLALILLLLSPYSSHGQVIFSADGSPQIATCQTPDVNFVERPNGILAVPGEFSGATAFPGRMRPRVFAYNEIQTRAASTVERAAFTSPYPASFPGRWKLGIGTTVFWRGERPSDGDPGNLSSAWVKDWRSDATLNPFYVALPYNDIQDGHTKPEAALVIPWFKHAFIRDGQSVLKDKWIAIRHGDKMCYAQWEDVGPFQVDHWQYVFGNERPRPNRNQNAGLDVSPAVRDYLGLENGVSECDWKFVDHPMNGPWTNYTPTLFARLDQQPSK